MPQSPEPGKIDQIPDSEHYLRTLKVCEIDEGDYFSRLICEDITSIAKDIKESHRRDVETGDENNPLTDVIDVVKEFAMATDPMKATLPTLSKQLGMNFNTILCTPRDAIAARHRSQSAQLE